MSLQHKGFWESLKNAVSVSPRNRYSPDNVKLVPSRFGHLDKFSPNVSVSWFVIRVNLFHPKPSLFLYLSLINRVEGLYGRMLTEVVSADRTQR